MEESVIHCTAGLGAARHRQHGTLLSKSLAASQPPPECCATGTRGQLPWAWPPHHLPGLAFISQCSKKFSWETPFPLTAKMTSRVISF